jgi:hypothetical protein
MGACEYGWPFLWVTLFARALMTIRTRPVTIRTRPHLAIQKRGGDLRARDCLFTRSNCNAAYNLAAILTPHS